MTTITDLGTPALLVDGAAFEHNLATMAAALPGSRLRPHVKAHKTTALARCQREMGHTNFTCATPHEVVGMAGAGLGDDLLLANQTVDDARLRAMAALDARVTVAVDSDATIDAAAAAGIREVLIDVDVGMPRCGCDVTEAGGLAESARAQGLDVRGVMGYEGHVVGIASRAVREEQTAESMAKLLAAHGDVGGDVISAGGTGTYDVNTWANEIQAGSYALIDTAYAALEGNPFRSALSIIATIVSVCPDWAVADCGLKALGMDHGNPAIDNAAVLFCADEHIVFVPEPGHGVKVDDRIRVWPAHVDPTIAYHERMHVTDGEDVIDTWAVDLRGW